MPRPPATNEDCMVDVHAPEVPAAVRQALLARMQAGDTLWRCPRLSAPQGPLALSGVGRRTVITERWLVDTAGTLVEVFWQI